MIVFKIEFKKTTNILLFIETKLILNYILPIYNTK